tara:strand:- start:23276 stop:24532 length:1257 start_codon:yes stop_codon:yes gene_type:complete
MELRDYQQSLAKEGAKILRDLGIIYLCMQVRTGKTLTSLEIAKLFGAKSVLFLTKKKAVNDIKKDYDNFGYSFQIEITNNESVHRCDGKYDLVISDEHHRNGAFPKPNKTTKIIKQKYGNLPMIFLSGTPTPESYSQIFHQFWISKRTPFYEYVNFYQWAKDFVKVTQRNMGYGLINDYSNADKKRIDIFIDKYLLKFTQEEAGFETKIVEQVAFVEMKPITYSLIDRIRKDKVIKGNEEIILADTGAKLMSKVHQLCSGTVLFESGNSICIDDSKAVFIKDNFHGMKIAIFYKFKAEREMILKTFEGNITEDLEEFNSTDKNIALQIVSGREGISLAKAKHIVYLNIDFSAVSYWQSRDRLTTIDRKENEVYWIFATNGIESKIYKAVQKKKNFTVKMFEKYERTIHSKENPELLGG